MARMASEKIVCSLCWENRMGGGKGEGRGMLTGFRRFLASEGSLAVA